MASYSEILFGRILLKNRLATLPQVQECLRYARGQTLGEVMIQRGIITPEQAKKAQRAQALMQFMRAEKLFARILNERRIVDLGTLRKAFEVQEQQRYKVRLAQILLQRNLVTPEQVEAVVDEQLMLLAEETGRIEEEGLAGLAESRTRRPPSQIDKQIDKLSKAHMVEDLDNSSMKRAVGPRGLLDGTPIQRTMPLMAAPVLEELPESGSGGGRPKRTMLMESRRLPPEEPARSRGAPPPREENWNFDDLVGKTLASRYRILEKVGEGGMGTVYKAEHCLMEKIVALKVLHPSLVRSTTSLERFRREIRATSRFQHKNVIQIYDAGEGEGGIFYMAMEFAEGDTLEEILHTGGMVGSERLLRILRQTLHAVGEAHKKNIVHRDLKSGNIMIVRDKDDSELVKVMDFGIAKIAFEDQEAQGGGGGLYKTQEGIVTGTPQYMSPEQASGEKVDHRSDLYSLGVILFEMLTGQLPFKSDTPMGFLGKHIVEPPPRPAAVTTRPVPTVLEEVTLKLLEKKPQDRYQTAAEVLTDLDLKCSGEGLKSISTSDAHHGVGVSSTFAPTVPVQPIPDLARLEASDRRPPRPARKATPLGGASNRKRKQLVLLLVLGAVLLVVGSLSLTLALVSSGAKDLSAEIAQAEQLLADGKPGEALKLIRPLSEAHPEQEQLKGILTRAEQAEQARKSREEAARLVQKADDLVKKFEQEGGGLLAARSALRYYADALKLDPRDAVQRKHDELARRIQNVAKPDQHQEGKTLLRQVNALLLDGKIGEAAKQLKRAEALLPPDDEWLKAQQKHLRGEQLLVRARQARAEERLEDARTALQQAAAIHPDRRAVSEIKRELAKVEAAIERDKRKGALGGHLATCLKAALRLDLPAGRKALAKAEQAAKSIKATDDPDLVKRRAAFNKLDAFASLWQTKRDLLERLDASGGSPTSAKNLLRSLRVLRERVSETKGDVRLNRGLSRLLEADIARAGKLVKRFEKELASAKSAELKSLEESIARFKTQAAAIKLESYEGVDKMVRRAQDLRYDPALRKAPAKMRTWVFDQIRYWRGRQQVWSLLTKGMVAIPGGSWTSPSSKKTHKLPKVYFISKTEVTCTEWRAYLRANPGTRPPDGFIGALGGSPVRNISVRDAEKYCAWRTRQSDGKVKFRLPTEGEWERAARGPAGTAFPWGKTFESWHPATYANVAGGQPKRVTRPGTKDVNGWGLRDTVGNVRELTRTKDKQGRYVICGGSCFSGKKSSGATARIYRDKRNVAAADVGLRVVAVEVRE